MKKLTLLTLLIAFTLTGCSLVTSDNAELIDTAVVNVQGADSFDIKYTSQEGMANETIQGNSVTLPVAQSGTIVVNSPDYKITVTLFGGNKEVARQWGMSSLRITY